MEKDRVNFSRQQQAFNASVLNAIPNSMEAEMQFFITNGKNHLIDHLKKLHLVFWKNLWKDYYKSRWGITSDDLVFVDYLAQPKNYNYLLVVHELVTLDDIYFKMEEDSRVKFSKLTINEWNNAPYAENLISEYGLTPGLFFVYTKRSDETYSLWHSNSISKAITKFDCTDSKNISNQFKDFTMDLIELLLWIDFIYFHKFLSFVSIKEENVQCIATLASQAKTGYAGVIFNDLGCEIYQGHYFGGTTFNKDGTRYGNVRKIIF